MSHILYLVFCTRVEGRCTGMRRRRCSRCCYSVICPQTSPSTLFWNCTLQCTVLCAECYTLLSTLRSVLFYFVLCPQTSPCFSLQPTSSMLCLYYSALHSVFGTICGQKQTTDCICSAPWKRSKTECVHLCVCCCFCLTDCPPTLSSAHCTLWECTTPSWGHKSWQREMHNWDSSCKAVEDFAHAACYLLNAKKNTLYNLNKLKPYTLSLTRNDSSKNSYTLMLQHGGISNQDVAPNINAQMFPLLYREW